MDITPVENLLGLINLAVGARDLSLANDYAKKLSKLPDIDDPGMSMNLSRLDPPSVKDYDTLIQNTMNIKKQNTGMSTKDALKAALNKYWEDYYDVSGAEDSAIEAGFAKHPYDKESTQNIANAVQGVM
jgi:hypothetical protein